MNEQKTGETLLLRDKLAELERQLANERRERRQLEKAQQKMEENFRVDISKCVGSCSIKPKFVAKKLIRPNCFTLLFWLTTF